MVVKLAGEVDVFLDFMVLDSVVSLRRGSDEDEERRIKKSKVVFITLKSIWQSKELKKATKQDI